MAIFRINKNENYTIMANYHLKEKGLSLKAKGLLSLMLSLPKDWDYSINGLSNLSKDGKDSVMSALSELEDFGYLVRTKSINEKVQFDGYDYNIYEQPYTEKPYAENPNTENPTQLNTIRINNKNNKKEINKRKQFVVPTYDEIKAYAEERNRLDLVDKFYNYYEASGWKDNRGGKVKNWKLKFVSWENNNPIKPIVSSKPQETPFKRTVRIIG